MYFSDPLQTDLTIWFGLCLVSLLLLLADELLCWAKAKLARWLNLEHGDQNNRQDKHEEKLDEESTI